MIWFLLQKIGFFIFLFLTIYFVVRRKNEALLALYFFGATFSTCYYFAVTIWSPTKVIALAMGLCYLIQKSKRRLDLGLKILVILTLFALICSDFVYFVSPPEYNQTVINPMSRLIMGNITYLSALLVLIFSTTLKKGFASRLYPKYCIAVEIAVIFGLIHYVCNLLEIEFMPILRQDGTVNLNETVIIEFGDSLVQRIYGVSGEPKNLGFLIVPYLVSSIVMYLKGRVKGWYKLFMIFLSSFVLIQTYSSSALIQIAIALPIAFFITKIKITPKVILSFLMILILVVGYYALNDEAYSENNFVSEIYDRSFGRGSQELEEGRQETDVFTAYTQSDFKNQLFGWGVNQYTFHAEDQLTIYEGLKPLQSGLIAAFADFGILGLICLIYLLILIIDSIQKASDLKLSLVYALMSLSAFIGCLMFGNFTTAFIYIMIAKGSIEDESNLIRRKIARNKITLDSMN